jgi:hypothetical protein
MSRFTSTFIIGAALAAFSLAAPLASAQTAPMRPAMTVSQNAAMPASRISPAMPQSPNACFTQDLVPEDDSSMLTICGAHKPETVSFAP